MILCPLPDCRFIEESETFIVTVTVAGPSDPGVEGMIFEGRLKLGGEMTWFNDDPVGDEERLVVLLAATMDGICMDEEETWAS